MYKEKTTTFEEAEHQWTLIHGLKGKRESQLKPKGISQYFLSDK